MALVTLFQSIKDFKNNWAAVNSQSMTTVTAVVNVVLELKYVNYLTLFWFVIWILEDFLLVLSLECLF